MVDCPAELYLGSGSDAISRRPTFPVGQGAVLDTGRPLHPPLLRYVGTVVKQAAALAEMPPGELAHSVYYVSDDAIHLSELCDALARAMESRKAIEVHPALIRTLGLAGDMLERMGMRAPISSLQARELTTNYPIPLDRTLHLVGERVKLDEAARETAKWAMEDRTFQLAVEGKKQYLGGRL